MFRKIIKFLIGIALLVLIVFSMSKCESTPAKYDSKKDLGPQINYTINGIEAGAGEMATTQKALKDYPNLANNNWQLQSSSTAAMTSTLDKAIKYKQPIVITGWQPHWMFKKFPLKFLKDPKGIYGTSEKISTVARKGLKKDNPGAYRLLKQFHWNASMMSDVMLKTNAGIDPQKAAKEFIKSHPNEVKKWLKDVPNGHGKKFKMTYMAWDSEIASTNVIAQLLRNKGYDVTIQAMDMQPMWISVATGSSDATVSAWLPHTAGIYYNQYKNKVDLVGYNLEGAKIGLAVPKYMKNINSIEDLNK
ncbi:glycine/betaine ABC transporter [Lactobacillus sp. S2-2]|uniref:glycine betaine ABC transporter substrate-binding protein n=1 Tax=Lactobacillus sp. S2-2 TaxID=2692917 RepID=UPI001F9DC0D7|nr:glycine betaine ABC transporter substrate-binding protein [Lactobacillus sp. S2-2]MCF6514697.1 glycine/betaine ABC transporter [Lactobacillus sp. S2-2]